MVTSTEKFSSVSSYFFDFLEFLTCSVTKKLATIILLFCNLIIFLIMKLIYAHHLKTPKILKNYKSEHTVLSQKLPEETPVMFR